MAWRGAGSFERQVNVRLRSGFAGLASAVVFGGIAIFLLIGFVLLIGIIGAITSAVHDHTAYSAEAMHEAGQWHPSPTPLSSEVPSPSPEIPTTPSATPTALTSIPTASPHA
jgi:hypothetical protein